jgi:aspartate aminotransferase
VAVMRDEYARRREEVLRTLSGLEYVTVAPPEGGFFAMADVSAMKLPSNQIRRRVMHDNGVVVIHGAAYGPGGEGTLRISFATGGDTLRLGLARLREGLR